jgi:long-subunit fatty acid transport protein
MMRILSVMCCLLFSASLAFGQAAAITKTGTTAASFLKIATGARSIGMGGAFTAVADDISSMYWNPAGLARMKTGEASFNHVNWIADINYDVASAALLLEGIGAIGVSVGSLSMGEMEITTTSQPEGTGEMFSAGGTMVSISYARNLTNQFSIGFTGKYVREHIWNESASSLALDIGTWYVAPIFNGLRIGASMANFGPKMRLEGRDVGRLFKTTDNPSNPTVVNSFLEMDYFDLPLSFRVGLSTDIIKNENSRLTIAADAVHPNDNTESVNSGAEYTWQNMLSLRLGWKSAFERDGEQGLTAGAGLAYDLAPSLGFMLDYAYQDFGRLKAVHFFSVGVKF